MRKIRTACLNTVQRHGWAILAIVGAIVMAHCLRTQRLGERDMVEALAAGAVLLTAGVLFEFIRLCRR